MRKIKSFAFVIVFALAVMLLTGCSIGNIIGGGENAGEESLQYSVEETQEKIKKLSSANGLEIKMKYTAEETGEEDENSETVFGIKDNIYWEIDEEGYGTAFLIDDTKTKAYEYYLSDGEWIYDYAIDMTEDTLASFESYFGLNAWLYFGHIYDGMLKKSGTVKVAGRDCIEYKYSVNLIVEKFEYSIAIDKETGATLKYDIGARVATESASVGFEVVSFKTSGIVAPNLPEPSIEEGDDVGGDLPFDDPSSMGKYDRELRIRNKEELYSQPNNMLVAKYVGSEETLLEDDLFVDDYGTLDIYWVWVGFDSENNTNRISGYTCLYYFFDDVESYNAGLEAAKTNSFFRASNDEGLYFTYRTYDVDGDTYEEMAEEIREGEYRHPNFELVD